MYPTTKFQSNLYSINISDSGDIENNELIKNDLIEQLDKYKRSRTSYLGKITQNISKINNLITLDNQIMVKEVEKYLHKIKTVSLKMIELSTDENEIKTITLKVTEQEFHIVQRKKSIKNYKKENLDLSPKNSEVLLATSKSGSSKKETKNAENDIKPEATTIEQQYDAAKSIILSDAQDEYENKQPFEFSTETSELETKPNRTFNLYPNVIVKQRDTALRHQTQRKSITHLILM